MLEPLLRGNRLPMLAYVPWIFTSSHDLTFAVRSLRVLSEPAIVHHWPPAKLHVRVEFHQPLPPGLLPRRH